MNTCYHNNYVKTQAYAESLKNVFANMCLRSLQLIGDQALKRCMRRLQQLKEKHLPLKSDAFDNSRYFVNIKLGYNVNVETVSALVFS